MKRALSFALLALAPSAAFAAASPHGSGFDHRIQSISYNPGQVVSVHAAIGIGTAIIFDADEEVLDIASGFAQGWEFSHKRNVIYLKPKSVQAMRVVSSTAPAGGDASPGIVSPKTTVWKTNLLVTTNKRFYAFDLFIGAPRDAAYRVLFSYPEEIAAKAAAMRLAAAQAAALRAVDMTAKPTPLNYAYTMQIGKGSNTIAPGAAWDDGRFTYLRFATGRDVPSVFLRKASREEEIVDSHAEASAGQAEQDTLVVHGVFQQLALRSGGAVVFVNNERFDGPRRSPDVGTTVPGVERTLRVDDGSNKVLPQ